MSENGRQRSKAPLDLQALNQAILLLSAGGIVVVLQFSLQAGREMYAIGHNPVLPLMGFLGATCAVLITKQWSPKEFEDYAKPFTEMLTYLCTIFAMISFGWATYASVETLQRYVMTEEAPAAPDPTLELVRQICEGINSPEDTPLTRTDDMPEIESEKQ